MPRKKKKYNIIAAAELLSAEALQEIKRIAFNPSLRMPSVKLAACNAIIDRAFGKPTEHVETKGGPRIIEVVHTAVPATGANKPGGVGKDMEKPGIIAGKALSAIISEPGQGRIAKVAGEAVN